MADSLLGDEAKELLDNLARALPKIKYKDDGNGNIEYEPNEVSPFVDPVLEAVGLAVWLEIPIDGYGDSLKLILRIGNSLCGCGTRLSNGKIYPAPSTLYPYATYRIRQEANQEVLLVMV